MLDDTEMDAPGSAKAWHDLPGAEETWQAGEFEMAVATREGGVLPEAVTTREGGVLSDMVTTREGGVLPDTVTSREGGVLRSVCWWLGAPQTANPSLVTSTASGHHTQETAGRSSGSAKNKRMSLRELKRREEAGKEFDRRVYNQKI